MDAGAVRRWGVAGLAALRRHQAEIDALNVYPVPDGDTGTNLVLTMTSAVDALDQADGLSAGLALQRLARGALLGARGNSGVILSQLLRGVAEAVVVARDAPLDGRVLAEAFHRGALDAYDAVAEPVEGTILSVAAAAARAAKAEVQSSNPPDPAGLPPQSRPTAGAAAVARVAALAARDALALTPRQLPVLARAGVVDAGGRGLVVLLDALVEVLGGEAMPAAPTAVPVPAIALPRETGSDAYGYEVQFLLDAPAPAVEALKATLGRLGDSLVIVGSEPTWHVHVHVNDVGAAVEAGVDAGRPSRISVTRFADQTGPPPPAVEAPAGGAPAGGAPAGSAQVGGAPAGTPEDMTADLAPDDGAGTGDRGVVVVCAGAGLGALFAAEGATVIGGTPSTAEVLAAIEATGKPRVVVLPNDGNGIAVARAAAGEARTAGIRVGVVPTRSPVQGLAALAVRDPGRRFEDDVIAMAEAAGACRYAEITRAGREALTVAGRCQPGDVLALVEGEVNLIGHDLRATCRQLLDRLLAAGGELVTLVTGEGAPDGLGAELRAHVAGRWPFVEVQCYEGGQPLYPLLVGVE